jgi:hypothetical protein
MKALRALDIIDISGTSDNTNEDSGDEVITTAAIVNGDDRDKEDSSGLRV